MSEPYRMSESEGPVHLTVTVLLVSIGLIAEALAATLEGVAIALAMILGGAVIASAFFGLPGRIVSSVRSDRSSRLRNEAYYGIAVPLVVGLVMGWLALRDTSQVSYMSLFTEPEWTDYVQPVIHAAIALMNLGVLVSNVVSLRRRSSEPHS